MGGFPKEDVEAAKSLVDTLADAGIPAEVVGYVDDDGNPVGMLFLLG